MHHVSEAIFTTIEGLIFILAFSIISNKRKFIYKHYFISAAFALIYTFYTYPLTQLLPPGVHTFPIVLITAMIFKYIFNESFIKSIIKHVLNVVVMLLIELCTALGVILITGHTMDYIVKDNFYTLLGTILTKSIELIIVIILLRTKFSIAWLNDLNLGNSRFNHILIVNSSALFLNVVISIYIISTSHNSIISNVLSFVINAILVAMVVMAYREGSRLEIVRFASELKKESIQQLIEFNEMVAKERHEYKNHLNTIFGLCTLNKPDLSEKIKLYINNYANNCEARNIVIDSGNDFVDAIINVKYNNALRKGIDVIVDFEAPLSLAKINEDVAVTIISNIIENAFESIVSHAQEKKYINIQTYIQNNNYYISISNNGPMITEADKKKIFNTGYSTKENSSKKRGFGLSIVLTEIERCGGSISINSNEQVTEFLIMLNVNEQQAVV